MDNYEKRSKTWSCCELWVEENVQDLGGCFRKSTLTALDSKSTLLAEGVFLASDMERSIHMMIRIELLFKQKKLCTTKNSRGRRHNQRREDTMQNLWSALVPEWAVKRSLYTVKRFIWSNPSMFK